MTAPELVAAARLSGVQLRPRGESLIATPPEALTPDLRAQLVEAKPAVIERLRRELVLELAALFGRVEAVAVTVPHMASAEAMLEETWQRWLAGEVTTDVLRAEMAALEERWTRAAKGAPCR